MRYMAGLQISVARNSPTRTFRPADAMTIEIVDATPNHAAAEIAELAWSSGPRVIGYAYRSPEDWRRVVANEWTNKDGFLSYGCTLVAIDDARIAGMLLGHSGQQYAEAFVSMRARMEKTESPDFLAHLDAALVLLDRLAPYPREQAFHVLSLAVRPAYQRQGLGRRLIEAATARARRLGCTFLSLDAASKNEAVGFYRYLGFEIEVESRVPKLEAEHGIEMHYHMVLPF